MSKKSLIQRELKREKTFKKFQEARNLLKDKMQKSKTFEERIANYSLLQKMPRNSSKTRLF